jgi:heat-inducible transcriptional repressor
VPVNAGKALVITVTTTGIVKNCLIKIPERVTADTLIRVSNIINEKLSGLSIEKIDAGKITEIEKLLGQFSDVLLPVLYGVSNCIRQANDVELYIDGSANLFNFPEFRDIVKAKGLLDLIDEKITISRLLSDFVNNGIRIIIGSESEVMGIRDCSLITASYITGKITLGSIGVIGPTRMDYAKVVSSLRYISERLEGELSLVWGETADKKAENQHLGR